jgi:hypothetical protein
MRFLLALALVACGGGPPRPRPQMPEPIETGAVYARLRPSFVVLRCMGQRYGTGFGFGRPGRVATAAHVVQCPREITAELADGTLIGARVVAMGDLDIALLELVGPRAAEVLPLEVRDEPLPVGAEVIAVGFPIGPDEDGPNDHTISRGILGQRTRGRLIHDAAISPGSSGGPVLDHEGRVVGLDYAIPGGGGQVALAVPIEHVLALHRSTPANTGDPRDPFEIGVELGLDYAGTDDFTSHLLGAEIAGWVSAFDQIVGTARVLILGRFASVVEDGTISSGLRWAAEVDLAYRLRLDWLPFAFELAGGFSLGFDTLTTTTDEIMLEDPSCDPATQRCAIRRFSTTTTTDRWLPRPLLAIRISLSPFIIGYSAVFDVDEVARAEHRFTLRIRFL